MYYSLLIVLFALSACNARSPEHYLAQARSINYQLLEEIERIEDLDLLLEKLPHLQRLFNELVDVMIEAKKWQLRKKIAWPSREEDRRLSRELQREFCRLYQIPTARALVEKCQESALMRLDAFERKLHRHPPNLR